MRNLKLTLAYDGAAFCGFQIQPNGPTVQAALEDALLRLTGERIRITGCSRTDAGVHASMFVCNFFTQSKLSAETFVPALNFYLPRQIAVQACEDAPEGFHARYDCLGKTYVYKIHNSPVRSPFLLGRAVQEASYLDIDFLNAQASDFLGTHDFASFCAAGASVKTTTRTITRCDFTRAGSEVLFTVSGDGFLYNMVRIMTGTLLDIARGKLPTGAIPAILAAKDRAAAGVTAPPEGLWLIDVRY